jgi:hypothetical protein
MEGVLGNPNYASFVVEADIGAVVNLSGVTNIAGANGLSFYSTATNGVVNLSSLRTFTQDGSFEAGSGGAILADNLNSIVGVSLYLDDSNSVLALAGLTNISGGGYNTAVVAGQGSVLDLSSVQNMEGVLGNPNYASFVVEADIGAVVNLSGVTNIAGANGLSLYSTATNGKINLSRVQEFAGPVSVEVADGGAICATNLRYVVGNFMALATGTSSILNFSGSAYLEIGSGSDVQFTAQNGGLVSFHCLHSISGAGASFLANGAGSVIDLSSLSAFTTPLSTSSLLAENGGVILLNCNVLLLQNVAVNWAGCTVVPAVIPASSSLSLYEQPWNSYWIDVVDTRNPANQWQLYERIPATNGVEVLGGPPEPWQSFQVYEFVANQPILDLNRLSRTNVQLVMYGTPTGNYGVQTTASLDAQPIDWTLLETTGIMTNSFCIFAPFAPTDAMRVYRAQQQ